jgi:uncharacterized protein YndB with AHSA1/START domain
MTREMIHGIEIHAEPRAVFTAIASRSGLASFWTADVKGEDSPGGELTFGFTGAPMRLTFKVIRAESSREVEWTCVGGFPFWADTSVTWSLAPVEGGARVVFSHSGFPDEMPDYDFGSVSLTWALVVARLKEVIGSGGTPNPALP